MNNFLHQIAKCYYEHYPDKLSHFTFVFPGKRAGLFFSQALNEQIKEPIIAPQYTTIANLMEEISGFKPVQNTTLLFELYTAYCQVHPTPESFDDFLFWGEMILADFNDIDLYHVDAQQLFRNLTDLKQIDTHYSYLHPKQVEAIRTFWTNFFPINTETKEEFIHVWKLLLPLYEQLKKQLDSSQQTYGGALFRHAANKLKEQPDLVRELPAQRYIFCGFNALSSSEEVLFSTLRDAGKADFYWDYTEELIKDLQNPAYLFIRKHIKNYPSRHALDYFHTEEKQVHSIAIPSTVGMAQRAGHILDTLHLKHDKEENTAWVLADENLLLPALQNIPESVDKINVTMGYPIKNSLFFQLIQLIIDLQAKHAQQDGKNSFYYKQVLPILRHPLIAPILDSRETACESNMIAGNITFVTPDYFDGMPLLSLIFSFINTPEEASIYLEKIALKVKQDHINTGEQHALSMLEQEFIYYFFTHIQQLQNAIQKYAITLNTNTYLNLLKRLFERANIAFQGEPLCGIQILGILETRCLDFSNIIISSMNEDIFPKKDHATSFIPHNLRRGFGLPTNENKEAIFAYYFFRLFARAKNVWLLHDQRSAGMSSGEASRFTHLIKYHYAETIPQISFHETQYQPTLPIQKRKSLAVEKQGKVITQLQAYFEGGKKKLSASAINTYIDCPLRFYLKYLLEIKEAKSIHEDIDQALFGTVVHGVLEEVYRPYVGKDIEDKDLYALLSHEQHIRDLCSSEFVKHYYPEQKHAQKVKGRDKIALSIIEKYVVKILKHDAKQCPFTYLKSEQEVLSSIQLKNQQTVQLKGFIDRVDRQHNTIRIVDYKTGSDKNTFKSIEELFDPQVNSRPKAAMQLLFYCYLLKHHEAYQHNILQPHLYLVRSVYKPPFFTQLKLDKQIVDSYSEYADEYELELKKVLEELFSPEVPFSQTQNKDLCSYCAFKTVCH